MYKRSAFKTFGMQVQYCRYNCTVPLKFPVVSVLQLLSFHINSINVMVLNLALPESLWHMTSSAITLLLDHQSKRWLTCEKEEGVVWLIAVCIACKAHFTNLTEVLKPLSLYLFSCCDQYKWITNGHDWPWQ